MSNQRRAIMDDSQLTELFRDYVDTGVRAFDPSAITARAIAVGGRPMRRSGLALGSWPAARRISPLMALGLLLLGAAVALVGAAILLERRPMAGVIAIAVPGETGEQVQILGPDGTVVMILPPTGHLAYPVWSPDGTRIAFSDEHNRGPIRVVNADGTGHRPISGAYDSGTPAAWSPDSRQLAFLGMHHDRSEDMGLTVVAADGTDLVRLRGPEGALVGLAWAPDGSLISGVGDQGYGASATPFHVYAVDPQTGEMTRVSESRPAGYMLGPSWSPDSSRLLYAVEGAGRTSDIAAAERAASGWVERIIVSGPTSDVAPLWLDADRFVFVRDMSQLIVANADGSGERVILRAPMHEWTAPCVSPDGSGVAVVVGETRSVFPGPASSARSLQAVGTELVIVAVDGTSEPVRIPIDLPQPDGPACSWHVPAK